MRSANCFCKIVSVFDNRIEFVVLTFSGPVEIDKSLSPGLHKKWCSFVFWALLLLVPDRLCRASTGQGGSAFFMDTNKRIISFIINLDNSITLLRQGQADLALFRLSQCNRDLKFLQASGLREIIGKAYCEVATGDIAEVIRVLDELEALLVNSLLEEMKKTVNSG